MVTSIELTDWLSPRPGLTSRARTALKKLLSITYPTVKGADLSHWNTVTSFAAAKAAGYEWVAIKATESTTVIDSKFTSHWQGALAAGLLVMPYHFFRCDRDGAAQASFFLDTIQPLRDATQGVLLPPVGDFETTDGMTLTQRQSRAAAFLAYLENNYRKPVLYSSPALWPNVIGTVSWAANYYGWVAHWTPADAPTLPVGWDLSKRLFWQYGIYPTYSWAEPVPGVSGAVDVDRFFGTLADLQVLAGSVPPPPPPPDQQLINPLYTVKVTATALNVRAGPGAGYDDLGDLRLHDKLPVVAEQDGWLRIDGWISSAWTQRI